MRGLSKHVRALLALPAALIAVLVLTPAAAAVPHTTVERTIQDCDGDNLLEFAPGEEHLDFLGGGDGSSSASEGRERCGRDESGDTPRLPRDASVLNFLHLSDFQMVDEESPGRVEFFDYLSRFPQFRPFASAYRPQESLTTQVTEAMVRQARNTTSPVTGAQLDHSILTGDNADSQQYNETRWFIDILDGTVGPGNPDPEMDAEETSLQDRKIDPDSGIEEKVAACKPPELGYTDNDSSYDGVRDNGEVGRPDDRPAYYEPDHSGREQRDDGDGYSPNRLRNRTETGDPQADVTVRDFPGLLEEAQERFEAVGLGMPWYSAFGNHDALVQGNSGQAYEGPVGPGPAGPPATEAFNPTFHAIVTGCLKPTKLPPGVGTDEDAVNAFNKAFYENPQQFIDDMAPVVVPPDERRCYLGKAQPVLVPPPESPCATGSWIDQHFRTTGTPVGHGFEPSPSPPEDKECEGVDRRDDGCVAATYGRPPEARLNHDGYYSYSPRPNLRFVVLDSVTDECVPEPLCSEGSIDDPQFRWLDQQIGTAEKLGQYVLVFSHHTLQTTRWLSSDTTEYPLHYGERGDRDPQPENPAGGETLEERYCRSPNVIAHVDGHEHENFVKRHDCLTEERASQFGGFTEISTAAHIDWPQQARMIELIERGGELSMVLTILDHDGPAYPGEQPQCRTTEPDPQAGCELKEGGQATEQPVRLSSIGREIAYNDYQSPRGARGGREDRNVIIKTNRPWPSEDPATAR